MAKNFKKLFHRISSLRAKIHHLKNEQRRLKQTPVFESTTKTQPTTLSAKKEKIMDHVMIHLSMASVAKATLVIMALFLLGQFLISIKATLVILFVSLFLASALDSIIDFLQSKRIPRGLGLLIIYFVFFIIFVFFLSTLIPLVALQTLELAKTLSHLITNLTQSDTLWNLPYADKIQALLKDFLAGADQQTLINNLQSGLEQIGKQLQNIAGNTWDAVKLIFNGVFNAILVLALTFFFTVDEKGVEKFLISVFPSRHSNYILQKSSAIKENIGYWLRGQVKLMLVIGVLTFAGLSLLNVEYALTLAFIAAITELIPVVGPFIAMVPALLIGFNHSPAQALWVFLLYILIQQFENNIIVPIIMKNAVGLSPIIIILSMLIGFTFLGIIGVIIAVPVATALSIFIKDYIRKEK